MARLQHGLKKVVHRRLAACFALMFAAGSQICGVYAAENSIPLLPDSEVMSLSEHIGYRFQLDIIPYQTQSLGSGVGEVQVIRFGVNGLELTVLQVTADDDQEASEQIIRRTVIRDPVNQVVYQGAGGVVTTKDGEYLPYSKAVSMKATAYTTENKDWQRTFSGTVARVGAVAVDPSVIPLGSRLYIRASDGESWVYGLAVAEDTGVKGNMIDLFFDTYDECIRFGVRACTVYVLE